MRSLDRRAILKPNTVGLRELKDLFHDVLVWVCELRWKIVPKHLMTVWNREQRLLERRNSTLAAPLAPKIVIRIAAINHRHE